MTLNPRYVAYCHAQGLRGENLGERMLAIDDTRWPGGIMCGFILWMQEQWRTFEEKHYNRTSAHPHNYLRTLDRDAWRMLNSDAFDVWLQDTYVNANSLTKPA